MMHTIFQDRPSYKKVFYYSLVVFIVLQGVDLITTLYGLRHGGVEANEHVVTLGAYLHSIDLAVVIDKVVFAALFTWIYSILIQRKDTSYFWCILSYGALNAYYVLVAINNVAVILIAK